MGTKKQWTGKEKLAIVLQGLKGNCNISELCNEYGITQSMYYKWCDQLLSDGAKLFERGGVDHVRERLERENRKLKETIGELTIELKKRVVKRRRETNKANLELLTAIQQLKGEHPYWGYRRIWAYLKRRKQFPINHKRIYRLMNENNLLVPKNRKLIAPRSVTTHKPRTKEPNRCWGIDMTKIMLPNQGWIYLHVVIDWGSKKLLSAYPSLTSKTGDWLMALNEAVNRQFPRGIMDVAIKPALVSDHGCQPTSQAFKDACVEVGIQQIFASYSNPKGNAETERMMRTIKEDLVWPREFDSSGKFKSAVTDWIRAYNEDYPHSAIGYMTPYEYERWYQASVA